MPNSAISLDVNAFIGNERKLGLFVSPLTDRPTEEDCNGHVVAWAFAGISPRKAIEEYTSADIDGLFEINAKGPIYVTRTFLPQLRKQASDGVVVHVGGAMDGRVALPFMSSYAASRAALASYVQSANREIAGTNVEHTFFGPVPSNTEVESPYFDI